MTIPDHTLARNLIHKTFKDGLVGGLAIADLVACGRSAWPSRALRSDVETASAVTPGHRIPGTPLLVEVLRLAEASVASRQSWPIRRSRTGFRPRKVYRIMDDLAEAGYPDAR